MSPVFNPASGRRPCALNPVSPLRVRPGGRGLADADGRPFLWTADTAWEFLHRLDRAEADHYLDVRARQGFNVVMTVALAECDGIRTPGVVGGLPFTDEDPARPQAAWFDHVADTVARAEARGLRVALLPAWGDKLTAPWGDGPRLFRLDNLPVARGYGRFLGARLRAFRGLVWVLGGDRPAHLRGMDNPGLAAAARDAGFAPDHDWTPVWRELAAGLREGWGEDALRGRRRERARTWACSIPGRTGIADGHADDLFGKNADMKRQKSVVKLEQALAGLSEPDDYFAGLRREGEALPDNVLLFTRTEGRDLRPARAASAFHQRWVLIVALRGAGTVELDRVPYRLRGGQTLLVPPLHLHAYDDVAARPLWLFVTFDWPAHTALDEAWGGTRRLDRKARERLGRLVEVWRAPRPDGLMAAAHLLGLLRGLYPRKAMPPPEQDRLIARVRAAAALEPTGKLEALARRMGMSESHLRARFRREAGITLGRYLREARLRQAAVWLREEKIPVKVAAERAGYPDIFSFSRAFSRALGIPPSRSRT
jgi:AraC-like DNA-binding protein